MNCVGQPVRVDTNMSFNTGYFLASIIALFFWRIGILYALSVSYAERGLGRPTTADALLAN
jgi:hypothetical protein